MNNTSGAFWDNTGLHQLKSLSQGDEDKQRLAAKEAARQFEAIMLTEFLKAARTNSLQSEDDPMNSEAMKSFMAMSDQQMAFSMAGHGFGFAEQIEKMILQNQGLDKSPITPPVYSAVQSKNGRIEK
jgi:Rod binding domain-containing protein